MHIYDLVKRRLPRASVVCASALAFLLLVPPSLGAIETWRDANELKKTGGIGNFSDGIYRLNDYLLAHDSRQTLVILDWGIYYNLVGLSQGRLHCTQLWFQLNNSESVDPRVLKQLTRPTYRYVLHARGATNFGNPRSLFFKAARTAQLRPRLEQTIRTRMGLPLFEVYRVERRHEGSDVSASSHE